MRAWRQHQQPSGVNSLIISINDLFTPWDLHKFINNTNIPEYGGEVELARHASPESITYHRPVSSLSGPSGIRNRYLDPGKLLGAPGGSSYQTVHAETPAHCHTVRLVSTCALPSLVSAPWYSCRRLTRPLRGCKIMCAWVMSREAAVVRVFMHFDLFHFCFWRIYVKEN